RSLEQVDVIAHADRQVVSIFEDDQGKVERCPALFHDQWLRRRVGAESTARFRIVHRKLDRFIPYEHHLKYRRPGWIARGPKAFTHESEGKVRMRERTEADALRAADKGQKV